MTFYSDGKMKTEIVDPHYYGENDRVEFRLDRGTILSNLKLANFGLSSGAVANNGVYNFDGGVTSLIRNIHLYDGRVVLQSMLRANEHYAMDQSLKSNSVNGNVERFTKRHVMGYALDVQSRNADMRDIDILNFGTDLSIPQNDSDTNTNKGIIQLRELLPIVSKLPCLPSSVFKQLRLVIEYEKDARKFLTDLTNQATVKTTKPVLIVDRVVDDATESKLIAQLDDFEFPNYEFVNVSANAITAGRQKIEKRTLAFNNKFLQRLRLKVNYLDPSNDFNVNAQRHRGSTGGSFNVNNREVQYRVNGANVLPRGGIDGDNRRLALYNDTYGDVNMTLMEAQPYVNSIGIASGSINFGDSFIGTKDYDGVYIGQNIEELQLSFSRDFIADTTDPSRYNTGLRLVYEGEVMKAMTFGAGGYKVANILA